MKINRRKFIKRGFYGCFAAAAGTGVNAFAIEPNIVSVSKVNLQIPGLADEFAGKRLGHISDLHCGDCCRQSFLINAVEKVNALKPDAIVLTGDYTTKYDSRDYFFELDDIFAEINAPLGVFACLGNHDYGLSLNSQRNIRAITTEKLESNGINVLRNSFEQISLGGKTLTLIGLGDIIRGDCYPKKAFEKIKDSSPRIVISHNPDSLQSLINYSFDAFLCGHTHGGQVHLPFLGSLIVPVEDKRFQKGEYSFKNRFVYVNRGLATLPSGIPGPRFLCTPEITIYTLRRA